MAETAESRADERREMVKRQLLGRRIADEAVLAAMGQVPRHLFVPPNQAPHAYEDRPLLIGQDQTISQPYIVALMTTLARIRPGCKVLDVGTGSGYQAAVLSEMGARVYSVEIVAELAREARTRLEGLGYLNVTVRCGNARFGWPEAAPFDAIIAAAAPVEIPTRLIEELAPGGRLILPVGGPGGQDLVLIEKNADGSSVRRTVAGGSFVPMTGGEKEVRLD